VSDIKVEFDVHLFDFAGDRMDHNTRLSCKSGNEICAVTFEMLRDNDEVNSIMFSNSLNRLIKDINLELHNLNA